MAIFDSKGNPIGQVAASGPEAPPIIDGINKTVGATATKLVGLPVNLSGFGKEGIQKAVGGDTEGIFNKNILSMKGAQGGFLANLIAQVFDKAGLTRNIGSLEWANVSWNDLGGISPSAGGGQAASIEYGGPS